MSASIQRDSAFPRVAPTPDHRDAVVGDWHLNGERVRMMAEPDTGVLVALKDGGQPMNPLKVITRGRKVG
jgi:hypothetical protein